jgi:hypothetical protein
MKRTPKAKPTPCQRPGSWQAQDGPANDRVIRIRVSRGQRATMDRRAAQAGKTLSGWLRDIALDESDESAR